MIPEMTQVLATIVVLYGRGGSFSVLQARRLRARGTSGEFRTEPAHVHRRALSCASS